MHTGLCLFASLLMVFCSGLTDFVGSIYYVDKYVCLAGQILLLNRRS